MKSLLSIIMLVCCAVSALPAQMTVYKVRSTDLCQFNLSDFYIFHTDPSGNCCQANRSDCDPGGSSHIGSYDLNINGGITYTTNSIHHNSSEGCANFVWNICPVPTLPLTLNILTGPLAGTYEIDANGFASPLPVEMASFKAEEQAGAVRLTWLVQSEVNNEGFDVQRSSNGSEWQALDFVDGRGTTDLEKEYHFTDPNPFYGTNYYRLMQRDFDGGSEYSKVVSVKVVDAARKSFSVYPNPASGEAQVFFEGNHTGAVRLTVHDLFGKTLHSQHFYPETEKFNTTLTLGDLSAGVYLITLDTGLGKWQQRLVVK
ncbi:MAG: T9SS type A sorting domain-containing protein [Bacteroidota bacterium]